MIWLIIVPVLCWAVICLALPIIIIVMTESYLPNDILIILELGVILFFSPLWYPIKRIRDYFVLREVKRYVDEIRDGYSKNESKNKQKEDKNGMS